MATEQIMFPEEAATQYQGRNGLGRCIGLSVWTSDIPSLVVLEPINSKGNVANCRIELPFDQIGEVIAALTKIRDKRVPVKPCRPRNG